MLGRKPYASFADHMKSKLDLSSEICKYYARYFEPKSVELWRNASNESFGGVKIKQFDLSEPLDVVSVLHNIFQQRKSDFQLMYHLVVKIRGTWMFDDILVSGYIEMTNDELWRKSLGDIELDIYATGDVGDIIDLLWKSDYRVKSLVTNFIERFKKFEDNSSELRAIVFAAGVPHEVPVSEWYTSHFKYPSLYFGTFLNTMKELQPNIDTYIRLINRQALSSDLYRLENFKTYLKQVAKRSNVDIGFSSSLTLVGKKQDSYRKMYEELSASFFEIFKASLPRDKEVIGKLQRETAKLAGYKSLKN